MPTVKEPDIDQFLAIFRRFAHHGEQQISLQTMGYETSVASKIRKFHNDKQPISMLLPAFPWKNPNTDKVIGRYPDLGEELGLARLNHLCEEIEKHYSYGAHVLLVADGPVYNDLLGIPDADFYEYGTQLREMSKEKGFSRVKFCRLMDVLDLGDGNTASRDECLALAETCRREMESRHLDPNFDFDHEIEQNKDTYLTYQKYIKSARQDLWWGPDVDSAVKNDPELYAIETKRIARRMTYRLLAYEGSLKSKFPDCIRLSIHAGTGKVKVSVPLIPQLDSFGLTPWHSCVAVTAKGQYITGYSKDFRNSDSYELVLRDGKPYCLRERHPDFAWPAHVDIYHTYGGTPVVVNTATDKNQQIPSIEEKQKLARLALAFDGLSVSGFSLDR